MNTNFGAAAARPSSMRVGAVFLCGVLLTVVLLMGGLRSYNLPRSYDLLQKSTPFTPTRASHAKVRLTSPTTSIFSDKLPIQCQPVQVAHRRTHPEYLTNIAQHWVSSFAHGKVPAGLYITHRQHCAYNKCSVPGHSPDQSPFNENIRGFEASICTHDINADAHTLLFTCASANLLWPPHVPTSSFKTLPQSTLWFNCNSSSHGDIDHLATRWIHRQHTHRIPNSYANMFIIRCRPRHTHRYQF